MITYVPRSRSLEIGNDYIGTCPYAFLIHALAMHNEFLGRAHERKTMVRIDRIERLIAGDFPPRDPRFSATDPLSEEMQALLRREPLERADHLVQAEVAINQAKLAKFDEYERYLYANPFRYETERDVFDTLERLRGITRKTLALKNAINSLEDHARDSAIQQEKEQRLKEEKYRQAQNRLERRKERRGQLLNIALGMTGVFGAGQMFYWIGEKAAGGAGGEVTLTTPFGAVTLVEAGEPPRALFGWLEGSAATGNGILAVTEVLMVLALVFFALTLVFVLWAPAVALVVNLPDTFRTRDRRWPMLLRQVKRSVRALFKRRRTP